MEVKRKMGKKEKGAEVGKHTAPKRKDKSKRLLNSKLKELESPEAQILLAFLRDYPLANEMSLDSAELLWSFIVWLDLKKIRLVDEREVFCFPFSKLVRKGKLR